MGRYDEINNLVDGYFRKDGGVTFSEFSEGIYSFLEERINYHNKRFNFPQEELEVIKGKLLNKFIINDKKELEQTYNSINRTCLIPAYIGKAVINHFLSHKRSLDVRDKRRSSDYGEPSASCGTPAYGEAVMNRRENQDNLFNFSDEQLGNFYKVCESIGINRTHAEIFLKWKSSNCQEKRDIGPEYGMKYNGVKGAVQLAAKKMQSNKEVFIEAGLFPDSESRYR